MKLACNTWMLPGNNYREKFANLVRYGFEGYELRLPEDEATPARLAEIEEALEGKSIGLGCVVFPCAAFAVPMTSEESKCDKLKGARKALEIGARLGGPVMVTPEYRPQSPLPLWHRPRPLEKRDKELLIGFMSEVAEMAEKLSVVVVLEPINRYESHYYNRVEEVMAVCDEVGSQRLKLVVDFFHMQIEERDIAASIEKAAGYIHHVQLGDSNRELPGKGHTDFQSGFAALKRIGYDRYMALECRLPEDPDRDFPECVRFLRKCVNEANGDSR